MALGSIPSEDQDFSFFPFPLFLSTCLLLLFVRLIHTFSEKEVEMKNSDYG